MKNILESELSKDSFFNKTYISDRIKLESDENVCLPSYCINSAGIRFLLIARFHDAKIVQAVCNEKYGKNCIIMQIDFNGTTTEFKAGYRKFNIYFINAKNTEIPKKCKDLHIISLDCTQNSQKLVVRMELVYFTGTQENRCLFEILCDGAEVKPFN
ncbi:MAG: hypothetical protein J1G01_03260 [Clostridiales bacterium]|nr:hypothetical protein [Clostridiales bacterium]